MVRHITNTDVPVNQPVAPYCETMVRYLGHRAAREQAPYQKGDVVWLERNARPVKAVVLGVYPERAERHGEYRMRWLVARLNASAKCWVRQGFYTWPGHIQRGYIAAGAQEPCDHDGWSKRFTEAFPHRVELPMPPVAAEEYEFFKWLAFNVGQPGKDWIASFNVFRFRDEKQAIFFKLRWHAGV